QGSDQALYGTTLEGGLQHVGTVFTLNKDGSGYKVLVSFSTNNLDGQNPSGGLVEASDGALYGVTRGGGTAACGIVFKLNNDGSGYNVLYNFQTLGDGAYPRDALVEGSDGALYGTTPVVGNRDAGTVFMLNKDGSGYNVLYSFAATGSDGRGPAAGLVKATDGAFYGTTFSGGNMNLGTVFRLLPPQTPTMIAVTFSDSTAQVSFAGVSGYRYGALRSSDLTNWNVLAIITMPSAGVYTVAESTPASPVAYYRAVWVP